MKQIVIKSFCNYTLKAYVFFLESVFKRLNINASVFYLPTTERKLTLLKSPHVNKKAKEQFKISTYKVVISFEEINFNVFIKNFSYFILNKPKGLTIKVKS